ncbi:hypothetical protein Poly51_04260 [Rubripirellula tenax]|uniref:Ice-binding protein C-terminal domain-containing protein n=1 Tax=Rubripirellula tenax TaxID=2528015 RepID=A0A5C6FF66_9BACT|nr:SGNH/GDSL hydrolase family protein [Rubripirellula tenax]TWU60151.1 hypothetical protein Poly51_04260 [Rubripirellula tenax]
MRLPTSVANIVSAAMIMMLFGAGSTWGQAVPPKMGAVGDSLLDEHFDQSGFSGISLDYSRNAIQLMVDAGKIDAGPTGNWGGTRGTGYEYNWALAGSTTESMIGSDQHTNLASQAASAGVAKAVIVIGSNDLFPFPAAVGNNTSTLAVTALPQSSYESIYFGLATTAEIDAFASAAVARVSLAATTLRNAGIDVVVATAPEYGIAPLTEFLYPVGLGRERIDAVMGQYNRDATDELTQNVGVPVVDLYTMTKDIWGDNLNPKETFEIGGVEIDLNGTAGVDFRDYLQLPLPPGVITDDTPDAFTHDGIHPNTIVNGMFANLFMTAFNSEYGDNFSLFTEPEMLANASGDLVYTGDTITNALGGKTYANYVVSAVAVPEPSTLAMSCLASAAVVGMVVRRRHRNRRRETLSR